MKKLILVLGLLIPFNLSAHDMVLTVNKQCKQWEGIVKEVQGHKFLSKKSKAWCNHPCPGHKGFYCTRKKGHFWLHHAHGVKKCYFIWKTEKKK